MEKGKQTEKFRGDIVKKDNILNEGIYTIDTAEKYKLFLLMIAQVSTMDEMPSSPEEMASRYYSFYINDYADLKDIKNKYDFENYVADIISYLKDKSAITIKEENRIRTIWIFQDVEFEKDTKGIKVKYQFSYPISQFLFQLKEKFLRYHIQNIMPMKSKYSIRLYELLKQYEKIGERTFTIDEFREKIGARVYVVDNKTGKKKIIEDNYKRISDLKKRVINPAVKEINEYSDIKIEEVAYARNGRKLGFISFKFKPKLNFNFQKVEEIKEKVEADKNEVLQKSREIPVAMEITWKNIGELRKHYKDKVNDVIEYLKDLKIAGNLKKGTVVNSLSENEILFLLVNADKDIYDEDMIVSIIKKALTNRKLKNPIGFLIKTLGIDMKSAKFKELTLTNKKIDEELFKRKLEDMFVEGKSAREYIKPYWDEFIKPKIERGEMDKSTAKLIRKPLKMAVYDDFENKIYIPAPDEVYKDWLEGTYLNKMRKYLKEKFDIDDIIVEVIDIEGD